MEEKPDYSRGSKCGHSSDTIHHIKEPGRWSQRLMLSVAFITLGGSIPVGYICGTSTNPYHVEDSWVDLPMSTLRTLLLVGSVFGAAVSAILANWIGRRKTTLVGQVFAFVGAATHLVASITQSQTILLVAWLTLGLFIGIGECVLPMYLLEIAPHAIRTSVATVFTVGSSLGLLLSETLSLHSALGVGKGHSFLVPAFMLPVLVSWFLLRHVPESPIFLHFIKKDTNSAGLELVKLHGADVASAEAEFDKRGSQQDTPRPLTTHLIMIVLLCAANLSQALGKSDQLYHISGARPRLPESDVVAAGYTASVVNCIVALITVQLITTVSLRVLLITSCANCAVLLVIMAAFVWNEDPNDQIVYFRLVALLVQVIVFDYGLRPIPSFLACELFDVTWSATMMATGGAANFIGQLISDQMFLLLGVAYFRVVAALFLALFVILALIFLPNESDSSSLKDATTPKVQPRVREEPNPL